VYYLDAEIPFPSSKEKAGRFVGIAENVGDAMTFWIWTEDTGKLIARSLIRDAENPKNTNKRVEAMDTEENVKKPPKIVGVKDLVPGTTLPIIDLDHLVGYTFATAHAGTRQMWRHK